MPLPTTVEQCQKELIELNTAYDGYNAAVNTHQKHLDAAQSARQTLADQIQEITDHAHELAGTTPEDVEPGGNVDVNPPSDPENAPNDEPQTSVAPVEVEHDFSGDLNDPEETDEDDIL